MLLKNKFLQNKLVNKKFKSKIQIEWIMQNLWLIVMAKYIMFVLKFHECIIRTHTKTIFMQRED